MPTFPYIMSYTCRYFFEFFLFCTPLVDFYKWPLFVKNVNVSFFHSLLLVWEGHMRGIFWVSVLIFLEARHSFSRLDCTIYRPKKGRSWILSNMYAYDRGGGLQNPPQFRLFVFFGQQGKFGQSVLLLLLCELLLLLLLFFFEEWQRLPSTWWVSIYF